MASRWIGRLAPAAVVTGALLGGSLPAMAQDELPRIVWLEQGAGNPYWDAQHQAAAAAGEDLGFAFEAVSGNLDPAQQAATLTQLVDQKPAAIMLNAIDPNATAPGVQYAKDQGVPIVNLYSIDPNATASVTFDDRAEGEIAAKNALKLLEERYGTPTGTVAVLHGQLGQPASDDRADGFIEYMEGQEGVEVVAVQATEWDGANAAAAMQDWLVRFPDLSMVYALSDTLARPAIEVAERENRVCTPEADWTTNPACVIFVAVDGFFVEDVPAGKLYATQLYSPQWSGFKFAEIAYDAATGGTPPAETYLEALLVTPENGECVAEMQAEMAADPANFPFEGSLADIATARGCGVVTVE
jgi:ABC-type sugar transport system substrate-binding protein